MSDNDIEPALSDEEWKKQRIDRDRVDVGGWPDGGEIWAFPEGVRIGPAEEAPSMFVRNEDRHALGALALHEQPFGFSREDVETLRDALGDLEYSKQEYYRDEQWEYAAAQKRVLESLIARIEALLPPEPESEEE